MQTHAPPLDAHGKVTEQKARLWRAALDLGIMGIKLLGLVDPMGQTRSGAFLHTTATRHCDGDDWRMGNIGQYGLQTDQNQDPEVPREGVKGRELELG